MATATGNKKKMRTSRTSSGKHRVNVARKSIRRLNVKIIRFEKYKEEGRKGQPDNVNKKRKRRKWKSKRDGWNTMGLKKELVRQLALLKRGPKFKI